MPRIFARRRDTGDDGRVVGFVKGEQARDAVGIDLSCRRQGAQAAQEALPAQAFIAARLVEHRVEVHVD